VAQAAVGYVQYFTGVPEVLVGIHIAGASAVWAAAVWFLLNFTAPGSPAEAATARRTDAQTQVLTRP